MNALQLGAEDAVLEVSHASQRYLLRPVFSDVSFSAPAGSVVAVVGPAGSGKTSLLLAVAGRARLSSGSVRLDEYLIGTDKGPGAVRRAVRSHVAVSRIADLVGLDPQLTVRENVRDCADWTGVSHASAAAHVRDWAHRLDLDVPADQLVGKLPALEAVALHLVLAVLADPVAVVHDDLPHQLQLPQRARAWQIAREIAARTGTVVVASALDVGQDEADLVVPIDATPQEQDQDQGHGRHAARAEEER